MKVAGPLSAGQALLGSARATRVSPSAGLRAGLRACATSGGRLGTWRKISWGLNEFGRTAETRLSTEWGWPGAGRQIWMKVEGLVWGGFSLPLWVRHGALQQHRVDPLGHLHRDRYRHRLRLPSQEYDQRLF